jgi:hypothetical protein
MTLIENWKAIWYKLWSIRLALLAAAFGVLELALPALQDTIPHGWFAALSVLSALWGAYARLVPQPKLHSDATLPGVK